MEKVIIKGGRGNGPEQEVIRELLRDSIELITISIGLTSTGAYVNAGNKSNTNAMLRHICGTEWMDSWFERLREAVFKSALSDLATELMVRIAERLSD